MSNASNKQIEGIIIVAIIVGVNLWYVYQVFRPRVNTATTVQAVSTDGLNNNSLQQAADVARTDGSRYNVPVPPPASDELGKDQLF